MCPAFLIVLNKYSVKKNYILNWRNYKKIEDKCREFYGLFQVNKAGLQSIHERDFLLEVEIRGQLYSLKTVQV